MISSLCARIPSNNNKKKYRQHTTHKGLFELNELSYRPNVSATFSNVYIRLRAKLKKSLCPLLKYFLIKFKEEPQLATELKTFGEIASSIKLNESVSLEEFQFDFLTILCESLNITEIGGVRLQKFIIIERAERVERRAENLVNSEAFRCFAAPGSSEDNDRRTNKNALRIATFNTDFLFLNTVEHSAQCPGKRCRWKVRSTKWFKLLYYPKQTNIH